MGYVGKNPKFDSTILKDLAAASVDSPASGSLKVLNRVGTLYTKDSAGLEKLVGGGLAPEKISASQTADLNKIYLVDMASATADVTLTLPKIAGADTIGWQLKTVHATFKFNVVCNVADNVDGASQINVLNVKEWSVANADGSNDWTRYSGSLGTGVELSDDVDYLPTTAELDNGSGLGIDSVSNIKFQRAGTLLNVIFNLRLTGTGVGSGTFIYDLQDAVTSALGSNVTIVLPDDIVAPCGLHVVASGGKGGVVHKGSTGRLAFMSDNESGSLLDWDVMGDGTGKYRDITFNVALAVTEWQNSGTTTTLGDQTARTRGEIDISSTVSNDNGGTVQYAVASAKRDDDDNYTVSFDVEITGATSTDAHIVTLGQGINFRYTNGITSGNGGVTGAFTNSGGSTAGLDLSSSQTTVRLKGTNIPVTAKPDFFDANAVNKQSLDVRVTEATATQAGIVKAAAPVSVYSSFNQTGLASNAVTKVNFNTEVFDSENQFNTSTNEFNPQVAGKYKVKSAVWVNANTAGQMKNANLYVYKNGVQDKRTLGINLVGVQDLADFTVIIDDIIEFNGTTDKIDIRAQVETFSGTYNLNGSTATVRRTTFEAYRISD